MLTPVQMVTGWLDRQPLKSPNYEIGTLMRPTATTTGCAALTRINNDIIVTNPNTVLDGLDVSGEIIIRAPGCVLRRSIGRGGAPISTGQNALLNITHPDAKDFLIEDVTLIPNFPNVRQNGVYVNQPGTFRRLNVTGTVDGMVIYGDNVTVENSYLDKFVTYASDPAQGGGQSHNDGIQLQKGVGVKIVGNTIAGGNNTAIMVTQDVGVVGNLLIADNYLDGGGATVNFGSGGAAKKNLVVINNRFGPNRRNPGMAIIRNPTQSPLTEFGNVWDDTGLPTGIKLGS